MSSLLTIAGKFARVPFYKEPGEEKGILDEHNLH